EIKRQYGLEFAQEISMDPALMYEPVGKGRLQVICAYTSDGRIGAKNLRLLQDPKQVIPPYDAVLLLSEKAAAKPGLVEALRPLVGAISLDLMQEANRRVDVEHQEVSAAAEWLLA